ncbi:transposase [Ensifer canadensis]|uniref:transposase n=1 Tax=Ensifer canadensis TaxID=555315 RepID=UPI003B51C4F7
MYSRFTRRQNRQPCHQRGPSYDCILVRSTAAVCDRGCSYSGHSVRPPCGQRAGSFVLSPPVWGRDEAEARARLEAWNRPIDRMRGRSEQIFGTWKRSSGLRRMRWRGLAKAGVQIRLTAIAYNMAA